MVVVPRAQKQPANPVASIPRPDTLSLVASAAMARVRLAQADSTLGAARELLAADAERKRADSLLLAQSQDSASRGLAGQRDSLTAQLRALERLLTRAEQAPLPQSYRALAEVPGLRDDPRIRALLDSLLDVEREREGFGAVGGVDPIFVALTSRANEIGRGIQAVADERRTILRAELAATQPAPVVVATAPVADTSLHAAARDSALAVIAQADAELTRRRAIARTLDLDEERAREKANAVAPPLALLAAAFVLSAVIGFGTAFIRELRQPRIANATEVERFLGVRVLSTVETPMPTVERGRRQADRAAPPYFDPGGEGYQLAYLGLAADHPAVLSVTVTGDDQAIAAVVACNMAAIAADEARNTLVVDLDPDCSASAALRAPAGPGLVELVRSTATWPDVTTSASVGRDKTVALVPHGVGTVTPENLIELLRKDAARLARYYDAIVTLARANVVAAGLPGVLPSAEVVYCAQPGLTPLRGLRKELDSIRAGGGIIRGIVLWHAERPLLPTPRELTPRGRAERPPPAPAMATT